MSVSFPYIHSRIQRPAILLALYLSASHHSGVAATRNSTCNNLVGCTTITNGEDARDTSLPEWGIRLDVARRGHVEPKMSYEGRGLGGSSGDYELGTFPPY